MKSRNSYKQPIIAEKRVNSKREPYGQITIEVQTRDGLTVSQRSQPMHSFVGQWWRYFMSRFAGFSVTCPRYDGNGTTNLQFNTDSLGQNKRASFAAPQGKDDAGLVVGSGTASVRIEDTSLASPFSHGTDPGTIFHRVVEHQGFYDDRTIRITRVFENLSGAPLTIREIGGAIKMPSDTSPGVLAVRDVLDLPVTLPDDGILIVRYEMWLVRGTAAGAGYFLESGEQFEVWRDVAGNNSLSSPISSNSGFGMNSSTITWSGHIIGIVAGGGSPTAIDARTHQVDGLIDHDINEEGAAGTLFYRPQELMESSGNWIKEADQRVEVTWRRIVENLTDDDIVMTNIGIQGQYRKGHPVNTNPRVHLIDKVNLAQPITFQPGRADFLYYRFIYEL